MMFTDPYAVKVGSAEPSFLGALITFIGAGFGALQGYMNSNATNLNPLVRMFQFFMFSFFYQMLFFPIFIPDGNFYSFDPVNGAFGWLGSWHNFFLVF